MSKQGLKNPYIVGRTLTGEQGFYGRHNLVEEVVRTLTRTDQNTVVLHGQRRIGKSSLLHRLRRDEVLQRDHLPIFLDMQLYEGFPTARVLANLARVINKELDIQLFLPAEADLRNNYSLFHQTFMPEIYRHLDQKRLLLLVDEFDVVVPPTITDAAAADTLLGYLRTLIAEEPSRLAFVFVVGKRLDLFSEGYQRLFKASYTQPVGRLEQNETYSLLSELGEQGGISYSDKALEEIWTVTKGHPYLTQLMGFEIFNRLQDRAKGKASSTDVSACVNRAMEHGQAALDWFWSGFGPEQQWVLSAVADLTDRQHSVSEVEIEETLQQHLPFLPQSTLDDAYQDLLQGDFLEQKETRRYRFAVEFIRRWIVKRHPIKEIQREIEQISQDALNYYQNGRRALREGSIEEAINNFRRALELNPHFARVRLDLAVALRAKGDMLVAIEQAEEAYKQVPEDARDALIKTRLAYARQIKEEGDDEGVLAQAQRILAINPEVEDARRLVSDIYLERIEAYLDNYQFAEARNLLGKLAEPVPIIQDEEVGGRVRQLWLNYSRNLTQQAPPNWVEAQTALDSLARFDLLDEEVRTAYNQVTFEKARTFLDVGDLEAALASLENELKDPLPTATIKAILLDYLQHQIDQKRWEQGKQVIEGLGRLVNDEETEAARWQFYRRQGDAHLAENDFEAAIAAYRRDRSGQSEPAIADTYLRQAAWHLERDELTEAQTSYEQALSTQPDEGLGQEAWRVLESHFQKRQQDQEWAQAGATLQIMRQLGLAEEDIANLETSLYLNQAEAKLNKGLLDEAFECLALLGEGNEAEIKVLVQAYLRQSAMRSKWANGAAVLKRLYRLMPGDQESQNWRANWFFFWARALFPNDRLDQQPLRVQVLCQKVLKLATEDRPYLRQLRGEAEPAADQVPTSLRQRACTLLTAVLLDQAKTCLDRGALQEAHNILEQALNLPIPPDDLAQRIYEKLYAYHQRQMLKENSDEARSALKVMLDLGVAGPEIEDVLRTMPADEARQRLKTDEPGEAFNILKQQQTDLSDEERKTMESVFYQFSRLYAGRNCWSEAKEALRGLYREWTPPNEKALRWLDDLNREQLAFVRGRHELAPASPEQIKLLVKELEVVEDGYREARSLGLQTLDSWAEDFMGEGLALGQAYLTREDLDSAIRVYQKILGIESSQEDYRDRISQSLHNYSERMLARGEWDKARQALVKLKELPSATPDEQTRHDLRADGAIQRATLAQARAWLEADRVDELFDQFEEHEGLLPRPWPTGALKDIIFSDYQTRCERDDWPGAITVLQRLDQLLTTDPPQGRDKDVLIWLVDGLQGWGQQLEAGGKLEDAAQKYYEALEHTHQVVEDRSADLAEDYIRVAIRLAENCLKEDSLASQKCDKFEAAIQHYQSILALPECKSEDKDLINQALHAHSRRLAQQGAWSRAYQVLDTLDHLYPRPSNELKVQFAGWRRDLGLAEARAWLEEQQVQRAFQPLAELKEWLSNYNAPGANWADAQGAVKHLVYEEFCQAWQGTGDQGWEPTARSLEALAALIPKESQIIGWVVDVHHRWGQWLQANDRLEEAQSVYWEALKRAPKQQKVPIDQIENDLLDAQLAYAQQHLNQGNLSQAAAVYREILRKPGDYLGRADRVRHDLHTYSQGLLDRESPDWKGAHRALDQIIKLELDNEQAFEWRQRLNVHEIKAAFDRDELEVAFKGLDTMDRPWPWDDIQHIWHDYARSRIRDGDWQLAMTALQGLGDRLEEGSSACRWVYRELVHMGELIDSELGDLDGARQAYLSARDFGRQWKLNV